MRININSEVFGGGELKNVLGKTSDIQLLKEYGWFLENEYANGLVKDIRLKEVCFLAYNLNYYKNNAILVFNDSSLFKLHFEFDGDIKYKFDSGEKKSIAIKKGRFELFHIEKDNNNIESDNESKNSVEVFFDESYLKTVIGNEFRVLLSILKENSHKQKVINYGVFITDEIIKIIDAIKNSEYTGDKRNVFLELKIKELIIVAFAVYEDNYNEGEGFICEKESLQNIENHIKLNLKKELNILELSVLAGMNTSKFKKCFKELYGTTVFKYITSLRIERAKALIQQKSYTIAQASYEVGYKNAQHFTVAFKKKMGYLPSELKNKK